MDTVSSNSLQNVDAIGSLYLQPTLVNENTELKRALEEQKEKYRPIPQEREKNFCSDGGREKCTSGHGLAGVLVLGWQLDLVILEVFSNLNDSMIL